MPANVSGMSHEELWTLSCLILGLPMILLSVIIIIIIIIIISSSSPVLHQDAPLIGLLDTGRAHGGITVRTVRDSEQI